VLQFHKGSWVDMAAQAQMAAEKTAR